MGFATVSDAERVRAYFDRTYIESRQVLVDFAVPATSRALPLGWSRHAPWRSTWVRDHIHDTALAGSGDRDSGNRGQSSRYPPAKHGAEISSYTERVKAVRILGQPARQRGGGRSVADEAYRTRVRQAFARTERNAVPAGTTARIAIASAPLSARQSPSTG